MEGLKDSLAHAFSDFNEQRGGERFSLLITRQADKVLEIRVFLDLLNRLNIGKLLLVFDDNRPDH